MRYSPETLRDAFGDEFQLVTNEQEKDRSPAGEPHYYTWCVFRRRDSGR